MAVAELHDTHTSRRSDPLQIFAPVRALDARSLGGPTLDVRVPPGARIVREGELLGTFFLIRAGSAELWRSGLHIGTLGPGDCFGEVDPAPREQPFTVIAGPGVRVLTFSTLGIGRLCGAFPALAERLRAALPD